jgi:hypothetical protein
VLVRDIKESNKRPMILPTNVGSNSLRSMTLERARKILGKIADNYTDEQILSIIENNRIIALACYKKIETIKDSFGMSFFKNKDYLKFK